MPGEDRGGNKDQAFDRKALQATLADLVRAADTVPADAAPTGPAEAGPQVAGPQAAGPQVAASRAAGPEVAGAVAGAPVPRPVPRPQVAPAAPGTPGPLVSSHMTAQATDSSPLPAPDGNRPPMSGRPRLPFSPHPSPSPQGSPVGTVRPGSGGTTAPAPASGFRAPAAGLGDTGSNLGSVPGGLGSGIRQGGIDSSGGTTMGGLTSRSGLPGLGGRISHSGGEEVSALAPTPTEQPTIPLRRRKPGADEAAVASDPERVAARPGEAVPAPQAAPAPQPKESRPPVTIEAWVPGNDDILPLRSARSGRSFRRRR